MKLNQRSLTKIEQEILSILASANHALNAYSVFLKIIERSSRAQHNEHNAFYNKQNTYGNASYDTLDDLTRDAEGEFAIPRDKKKLNELVVFLRKTGGCEIPDYAKIVRILKDLNALKIIEQRTDGIGKSTAVYYLSDEIFQQIKNGPEEK